MRPQRAVEARELITDLGVTFIKIAQVWASRHAGLKLGKLETFLGTWLIPDGKTKIICGNNGSGNSTVAWKIIIFNRQFVYKWDMFHSKLQQRAWS